MKRLLCALLCLVLLCSLPLSVSAVTTVSSISLTLDSPKAGETLPMTATWHGSGYSLYSIDWYDVTAGKFLDPGEKAQVGHQYRATLWVEALSGYEFQHTNSYTPNITAKVNNQSVTANKAYEYNAWAMVTLDYTFPTVSTQTPAHTHIYTDWQYNIGEHYKNCTADGCYEVFFVEAHRGGTATCTQKPICQVCGFAYGMTEPDHTWSPTYLYQDKTGHAYVCAVCKDHSQVIPHEAGPTGTPDAAVVCKDCGYIITPEKNHTHKLTQVAAVEATCLQEGNIAYYRCSGCSSLFTDSQGKNLITDSSKVYVAPLGHATSEVWGTDDDFHWRVCTRCNTVLDETKMTHTDEDSDSKCDTCNYVLGSELPNEEEPTDATKKESRKKNKKDDNTADDRPWLIILLVALTCFGGAVTATVIILKKKKQK